MRRSKTIVFLYSLGGALLISLAGFGIYGLNYLARRESADYSAYLLEQYENTGKTSYLLQGSLLDLNRENALGITDVLLDDGHYYFANVMSTLTNDPTYISKAAENALFNLDFEAGEAFLNKLPEGASKSELIAFASMIRGDQAISAPSTPTTDAGKLIQMVHERNFSLYKLQGEMGRSIAKMNSITVGRNQNILGQANVLVQNNLHYLALNILEDDPGTCTKDFYVLKSHILEDIENYPEALKTAEAGLSCYPGERVLLEKAIEYHLALGNRAEAEYYRQRLKLIDGS